MIGVVGLDVDEDELELSFRRPPLNDLSAQPVLIGMGDPVSGPLLGLFYDDPSTPEQLAGPPDLAPAHSHPCDNFRIVMKGELWVGRERYHHGEFRLQRSGRPYGRDGDAPDVEGNWRIIFFADRRGHRVRPTNPQLRAQYAGPEAITATKQRYGDLLPVILDDDDDGVEGLVTTIDKPFSKLGHVDASFEESDGWEAVGENAHLAVSLMGVHDVGPVVICQRTAPGSVATPTATFGSDVFRLVIAGSWQHAGRTMEMGDTLLAGPGHIWDEVVAGTDGLDEVIIVGDRRGAIPQVSGGNTTWADALGSIVGRLQSGLGALADA